MTSAGILVVLAASLSTAVAGGQADAPTGTWLGSWTLPGGIAHDLHVFIEPTTTGTWAGTLTSLGGGLSPQPLTSLKVHGNTLTFSPLAGTAQYRFRGTLADDGGSMAGTVMAPGLERPGVFHLDRRLDVHLLPDATVYGGDIPIPGGDYIPITVYLHPDEDEMAAAVDLPGGDVFGYPVTSRRQGDTRFLSLPSPDSTQRMLLGFSPGGETAGAIWTRKGQAVPLTMHRDRRRPVDRPQVLADSGPWEEELIEVVAENEPTLHGRLMRPARSGPHPLVILLGDHGTDADGTRNNHPILKVLATDLAAAGIATLRIEIRPGGTALRDRQRDVRRWFEHGRQRPDVDPARMALLGHGEGGIAAQRLAAARDGTLAGLVLLGAPGLPGRELELSRIRAMLEQGGAAPEAIDAVLDARGELTRLALIDANEPALRMMARRWLVSQSSAIGRVSTPDDAQIDRIINELADPDTRYRLAYDPRATLARMRDTPLLALHGALDREYDAIENLDAFEQAIANRGGSVEVQRLDGLNHLLQPSATGDPAEYGAIRMTISPRALELIRDWLTAEMRVRAQEHSP